MFDWIQEKSEELVLHPDFWYYHGMVLSFNWLILAFLAILVRKLMKGWWSKFIHMAIFFIVDYTSLIIEVATIYRIYRKSSW